MITQTITVTAGSSAIVDMAGRDWSQPIAIVIAPSGGGTATVETSLTNTAATLPGSARWQDSGSGSFSQQTEIVRFAPCNAVRLKAFIQTAIFEVME